MAKSRLEKAVESQVSSLNDAQREIVASQFSAYKRNRARIAEIDDELGTSAKAPSEARSRLCTERNQLVIANSDIASKLFDQLGR